MIFNIREKDQKEVKLKMENEIIDESENWSGNRGDEGLSYKVIVMRQLSRVVLNSSKEMRLGFHIYSQNPNMNPVKINYIGDSRKELCQSLDCLHDLLMPKFDKDAKEKCTTLNEELEKIKGEIKEAKEFWMKKLKKYRELFQELCLFLERMGWLESGSVEQ